MAIGTQHMTRSELILRLHKTLEQNKKFSKLSEGDVAKATQALFGNIAKAVSTGRRVEIRGFGGFSLSHQKPRTGRNPKTGESVQVPAKYVPHFKAGQELRERVDKGLKKTVGKMAK